MIACFKIRAVPVNVNYRYVEDELAYLFNDADLVALSGRHRVRDADRRGARRDAEAAARRQRRHGPPAGRRGRLRRGARRRVGRRAASPPRSPDDLYIIYTGGTTGMPKGVMWRQEDLFFAGMGGGDPVGTPVSRPEEVAERLATRGVADLLPGRAADARRRAARHLDRLPAGREGGAGPQVRARRRHRHRRAREARTRCRSSATRWRGRSPKRSTAVQGRRAVVVCSRISSAGAILSAAVRDKLQSLLPKTMLLDNFGASETGFQGTARRRVEPGQGPAVHRQPAHAVARRRPQAGRAGLR